MMKKYIVLTCILFALLMISLVYAQGPGMMGRGYGYHHMGPGHYVQSEACQKFLDDTVKMRKELHNKRYDYFETARNPKSSPEAVKKMEKEIRELQEKIYSKDPQGCW